MIKDSGYMDTYEYCLALHEIEILQEVDPEKVDMAIAWEYGQYYQTAWKDSTSLTKKFMERNQEALVNFNKTKLNHMVNGLIDKLVYLKGDGFRPLPVDAGIMNTYRLVMDELETAFESDKDLGMFIKKHNPHQPTDKIFTYDTEAVRNLDILMRGTHHHYDMLSRSLDQSGMFADFLVDGRMKPCLHALKDHFRLFKENVELYRYNYRLISSLLAILYYSVYADHRGPMNLEALYKSCTHPWCQNNDVLLLKVRKLSGWSIEAAVVPPCGCIKQRIHGGPSAKGGSTYHKHPGSLVERYLHLFAIVKRRSQDEDPELSIATIG